MKRYLLCMLLAVLLAPACRNKTAQPAGAAPAADGIPADFQQFYDKFHRDSLYQIAHIQFPLKGLPSLADSQTLADRDFFWNSESWIVHSMQAFDEKEFRREWYPMGNNLVTERIIKRSEPMFMERRFARLGDEWFLIYYMGMNAYEENKAASGK